MMRTFVLQFCVASSCLIGGVGAFNYWIDPFLLHPANSAALQDLRPARERLSPWGKTYTVAVLKPQTVYLGNSRTELGLPLAPGFNAALSGASIGDAIAMSQHVMQVGGATEIIWGIDAPSFTLDAGNSDFERELVAGPGNYFTQRFLLDLKRSLAVDMTRAAWTQWRGGQERVCLSSLALQGNRDERCVAGHVERWGGTVGAVAPRVQEYVRGAGPSAPAMRAFIANLQALCAAPRSIRLYINPTHAITTDALYWAGKYAAMDAWRAELVQRLQPLQAHCDVRLFDFSGFNAVTTEPLPQAGGSARMANFWEPSHYRRNVGQAVLDRLAGKPGFGVELRAATILAHQAQQRQALADYHRDHPIETALARTLSTAQPFSQGRSSTVK